MTFYEDLVRLVASIPRNPNEEIYVAGTRNDLYLKIGMSSEVDKRIATLNTSSPLPIHLLISFPGGRGLEAILHNRFKSKCTNGEWFDLANEDWHFLFWLSRTFQEHHGYHTYKGPDIQCIKSGACVSCVEESRLRGYLPPEAEEEPVPVSAALGSFDPDEESAEASLNDEVAS